MGNDELTERLSEIIQTHFPRVKVDLTQFIKTDVTEKSARGIINMIDLTKEDESEGFILIQRDEKYSEARENAIDRIITTGICPDRTVVNYFHCVHPEIMAGCYWKKEGVQNG